MKRVLDRIRRMLGTQVAALALALTCTAVAGAGWQHLVTGEVAQARAFVDEGQRALARGDRGAAILAFERADALAPRAAWVRSALNASGVNDPAPPLTRILGLATPREWLAIAGAGAWVSGLALAILILRGRRRTSGAPGWVALSTGAACVMATAALVATNAYPRAVVIGADVPVRIAPYPSASAESSLASGTVVVVTGPEFGAFRSVRTPDGATGWVPEKSLESVARSGA